MQKLPYPFLYNTKRNALITILVSFAIFLINYLINDDKGVKLLFYSSRIDFSISFGIITSFFIILVFEVVPRLFFKQELKESWTLGKEILLLTCLFANIILTNYLFLLYVAKDFNKIFQFQIFLTVFIQGILIGFAPALIAVLTNYMFFLRRNLKEIKNFNEQLLKKLTSSEKNETEEEISILTDNKNETIRFLPSQLLFVKSEGNYIELYVKREQTLKKEIYRTSIQNIKEALHAYPHILRTHRCYLANLQQVKYYKGNARNFLLHFEDAETMVPVSRNNFQEIHDLLTVS